MRHAQRNPVEECLRAAEGGQAKAQFDLGLMYATGDGVPQDYITAHKWFNLAAVQGDPGAREHRSELARDMTAAEVAEAQRLAREWLRTQEPLVTA